MLEKKEKRRKTGDGVAVPVNSPARFSGGRGDREERERKWGGLGRWGAAHRCVPGRWGGREPRRCRRPRRPTVVEDEREVSGCKSPGRGRPRVHGGLGRPGVEGIRRGGWLGKEFGWSPSGVGGLVASNWRRPGRQYSRRRGLRGSVRCCGGCRELGLHL